jgi:nucleoside permease NupC
VLNEFVVVNFALAGFANFASIARRRSAAGTWRSSG